MRDDRVQLTVQVLAQPRSRLDVIDAQAGAADVQQVRLAPLLAQVLFQPASEIPGPVFQALFVTAFVTALSPFGNV